MFSSKERENQKLKLENELTSVTEGEQEELNTILKELAAAKDKDKIARKYLVNRDDNATFLGSLKIYKFAEKNAEFKAFCMQENTPHCRNWTAILKKYHHPNFSISYSHLSFYELYMGAVFLTKSEKADNAAAKEFWLDKSCQIGFFSALTKKIEAVKTQVSTATDPVQLIQDHYKVLLDSIANLYHFYGATGFFHAASYLYEISKAFQDNEASCEIFADMDNAESLTRSVIFEELIRAAAVHFTCGKQLYEEAGRSEADRLIPITTQKTGFKGFGFADLNEGYRIFFEKIKDKKTVNEEANDLLDSLHPRVTAVLT